MKKVFFAVLFAASLFAACAKQEQAVAPAADQAAPAAAPAADQAQTPAAPAAEQAPAAK